MKSFQRLLYYLQSNRFHRTIPREIASPYIVGKARKRGWIVKTESGGWRTTPEGQRAHKLGLDR